MLELAGANDLDPPTFWSLTPREFAAYMRGRDAARREHMASVMAGAWNTANFGRYPAKRKLPDLGRMIARIVKARKREQSPEQGLRIAEIMNARMGGRDLRPKKG